MSTQGAASLLSGPNSPPNAILFADGVSRVYTRRSHLFGPHVRVQALNRVSIEVQKEETLGVVGESGSGKTTLARLLLGLEQPDDGTIRFHGNSLTGLDRGSARHFRSAVAAVFQNPYSSLDPRMHIGDIVVEQLVITRTGSRAERSERAQELLQLVGLSTDMAYRYPRQLSGGQRQRVAIARALAARPEVIILDEPISALDVSVRAQVINLLLDLQERLGLAYVFVAHDLAIVRHMCHRVVVLYRGDVVERGTSERVLAAPRHPYTVALLEASYLKETSQGIAASDAAAAIEMMRKVIEDSPAIGCRYRLRCPRASSICETDAPALLRVTTDQEVACHNPVEPQGLDGANR